MVTLQGELLESGGALVGGAAPRTGISFGTADRTEIDKLSAEIGNLDAEKLQKSSALGELIDSAGKLATARQELESEKAAFQTRVTDYDGRAEEVKKRVQEAEEALKSREGMVEALQGEIIERKESLETLEDEIQSITGEISNSTKDLQAIAGGKSSKNIAKLQSELDEFREELSGKQSKFAALSAKTEATKSDVGRLKGDLDLNENEQKDLSLIHI